MLGRATLRIVLSSEMTSRATETTSSVHQRRSWMLLAVADMLAPPRITIRYGLVSLLKHSRAIYATPTLRIYVALVTVALCGRLRPRPMPPAALASARRATPPSTPPTGRAACLVRRAHERRASRNRGRTDRALRQRRQGDAPRCLPAATGRPAPKAARDRARASRPDDSPLGRRRGLAGLQHRRHRRARPARASRAHASLPRDPPVGPVHDRRGGPDALLPPHRPPDPEAPPPLRDAAAGLDRARRSAGASHAPARAAGRSTSRAAGAPAPAGWTTRWRCCAAAAAASRWRS